MLHDLTLSLFDIDTTKSNNATIARLVHITLLDVFKFTNTL